MKKMSNKYWLTALREMLSELELVDRDPRIAIIGVGHVLCGDDAAGVIAAKTLYDAYQDQDRVLILFGGSAPENLSGSLRRYAPDLVIMIDAADFSDTPGAIRWLDWRTTSGLSASTHTLPLRLVCSYLTEEIGCSVALLAIQPARVSYGPMSREVDRSTQEIVQGFIDTIPIHSQLCVNADHLSSKSKQHSNGVHPHRTVDHMKEHRPR